MQCIKCYLLKYHCQSISNPNFINITPHTHTGANCNICSSCLFEYNKINIDEHNHEQHKNEVICDEYYADPCEKYNNNHDPIPYPIPYDFIPDSNPKSFQRTSVQSTTQKRQRGSNIFDENADNPTKMNRTEHISNFTNMRNNMSDFTNMRNNTDPFTDSYGLYYKRIPDDKK